MGRRQAERARAVSAPWPRPRPPSLAALACTCPTCRPVAASTPTSLPKPRRAPLPHARRRRSTEPLLLPPPASTLNQCTSHNNVLTPLPKAAQLSQPHTTLVVAPSEQLPPHGSHTRTQHVSACAKGSPRDSSSRHPPTTLTACARDSPPRWLPDSLQRSTGQRARNSAMLGRATRSRKGEREEARGRGPRDMHMKVGDGAGGQEGRPRGGRRVGREGGWHLRIAVKTEAAPRGQSRGCIEPSLHMGEEVRGEERRGREGGLSSTPQCTRPPALAPSRTAP